MNIYNGKLITEGKKYAIIVARFNEFITNKLLEGSIDCLTRHGAKDEEIDVIWVPGAFEIPYIAKKCAKKGSYDAIICFGAVIRGATPHFDYVCAEVSKGVASISLEENMPVLFGVLTTNSIEQAIERAGTKSGNKGYEVALGAIELANLGELIDG